MSRSIILFLLGSLFIYACNLSGNEGVHQEEREGVPFEKVKEITSDLSMRFREFTFDKVIGPELFLEIRTTAVYGCGNYYIKTDTVYEDQTLSINVIGAAIGSGCLTNIWPATTHLFPTKSFNRIEINLRDSTDIYDIDITENKVTASPLSTSFSSFEYLNYYPYPKNSFAFYCGTLTQDSASCNEVYELLKTNLNVQEFSLPTDGESPYSEKSDGHHYNAPGKFFKYTQEEDLTTANAYILNYINANLKNTEGYGLVLVSWNDGYYRNGVKIH